MIVYIRWTLIFFYKIELEILFLDRDSISKIFIIFEL